MAATEATVRPTDRPVGIQFGQRAIMLPSCARYRRQGDHNPRHRQCGECPWHPHGARGRLARFDGPEPVGAGVTTGHSRRPSLVFVIT